MSICICQVVLHMRYCSYVILFYEGGARKSVRTPSPNIVEFKMKIKNLFSKLKSDFKEKRYDGLKKGA